MIGYERDQRRKNMASSTPREDPTEVMLLLFFGLTLVAYALILLVRRPFPSGVIAGLAIIGSLVLCACGLELSERGYAGLVTLGFVVISALDAILFVYLLVSALFDLPNPDLDPPHCALSSSWARIVCALALIGASVSGTRAGYYFYFGLRRDHFDSEVSDDPGLARAVRRDVGPWRDLDIVYDPTNGSDLGLWGEDMYFPSGEAFALGGPWYVRFEK